jgi:hypothetical protein
MNTPKSFRWPWEKKATEVLELTKTVDERAGREQELMTELLEVESKIAEMRTHANSGMDSVQTDLTGFLNTLEAKRDSLRAQLEEIGRDKPELILDQPAPEEK